MTYYIKQTKYNTRATKRFEDSWELNAASHEEVVAKLKAGVLFDVRHFLFDEDSAIDDLAGDKTAFEVYADKTHSELLFSFEVEDTKLLEE